MLCILNFQDTRLSTFPFTSFTCTRTDFSVLCQNIIHHYQTEKSVHETTQNMPIVKRECLLCLPLLHCRCLCLSNCLSIYLCFKSTNFLSIYTVNPQISVCNYLGTFDEKTFRMHLIFVRTLTDNFSTR